MNNNAARTRPSETSKTKWSSQNPQKAGDISTERQSDFRPLSLKKKCHGNKILKSKTVIWMEILNLSFLLLRIYLKNKNLGQHLMISSLTSTLRSVLRTDLLVFNQLLNCTYTSEVNVNLLTEAVQVTVTVQPLLAHDRLHLQRQLETPIGVDVKLVSNSLLHER